MRLFSIQTLDKDKIYVSYHADYPVYINQSAYVGLFYHSRGGYVFDQQGNQIFDIANKRGQQHALSCGENQTLASVFRKYLNKKFKTKGVEK